MLFRVAALLGMTVERLVREIAADEFFEWCAFYDLEPWGFQADAWCAGTVSATVANMSGRQRKRPNAKAQDWMPRRPGKKPRRRMTQAEMRARVRADIERVGKLTQD